MIAYFVHIFFVVYESFSLHIVCHFFLSNNKLNSPESLCGHDPTTWILTSRCAAGGSHLTAWLLRTTLTTGTFFTTIGQLTGVIPGGGDGSVAGCITGGAPVCPATITAAGAGTATVKGTGSFVMRMVAEILIKA